ncbi:Cytochrome b-c1 complex subunit 2, mitochondrial [Neolecta irregularis DAH-3]|uniref:Cytochrome b-c1 complex subunit 2, mitochondrial n=1 Tax=Neolecta irregularis (strain DAH-3) TaxID=1198029 RepID=A0A1U7LMY7_NEOID|nr:Cytochrome b-c1 complex subunit 2, mitochondrial [Neolecta irregularis DAH-3]|eukprot:OLL24007.1 Cytochrome b-c1 complex subunit 2, mitochondrial [Neolecta irregularis DAH-3]
MLRSKVYSMAPRCSFARAMATVAQISPFSFHVGQTNGIKIASRDDGRPTAALSVVVRAGSRYQPIPGLAHILERFAFKSTSERTALRITRESELLGGKLSSSVTRDSIILTAEFLREDLPYYVQLLGDTLTKTKLERHIFTEDVIPQLALQYSSLSTLDITSDALHNVAFRRGLGNTLYSNPQYPVLLQDVKAFANKSYISGNLSIVATGADSTELKDLVQQHFAKIPSGSPAQISGTTYYGGDVRINGPSKESLVILAFPGASSPLAGSPELGILANLLGGKSSIKWSAGNTLLSQLAGKLGNEVSAFAQHITHTDAGLLTVTLAGPSSTITKLAKAVVQTVHLISKGEGIREVDVKRAIAQTKFQFTNAFDERTSAVEKIGQSLIGESTSVKTQEVVAELDKVTFAQVKSAATNLLKNKASLVALGDTYLLPYADELSPK